MKPYKITAHTGCDGTPYNSVQSAQAGYRAGADILEVDVRATRDGDAVLYHDDEPDLSLYTCAEWMYAKHDPVEKLETILEQFLHKPVRFNLDLKTAEAYEAAAKVADRLDAWEQVYFTGVTDHLAHGARAKHVIWNLPRIPADTPDDVYETDIRRYCEYTKQAGFAGLNAQYESCRAALIRVAAEHELLVWTYTLPLDETLIRKYVDMGVDALSVKDISACIELAKRWSSDDAARPS